MIVFAPLSSSFLAASSPAAVITHGSSVVSTPAALPLEAPPFPGSVGPRSRKEWMAEWERTNPGRMRPPSAKSVYRLAEREYPAVAQHRVAITATHSGGQSLGCKT